MDDRVASMSIARSPFAGAVGRRRPAGAVRSPAAVARVPREPWVVVVWILPFLVVLEGALRKWVFPRQQVAIYVLKDFLLVFAYLDAAVRGRLTLSGLRRAFGPAGFAFGGFLAAWVLARALAPGGGPAGERLLGLRSYLLYPPLAALVAAALPSRRHVRALLLSFSLLLPLTAGVAIAQFRADFSSELNRYVWPTEMPQVAGFGGEEWRVRVTSTFSYITGYASYLTLALPPAAALIATAEARGLPLVLVLLGIALSVAGAFMTGSRAPVFTLLVVGIAFLVLLRRRAASRGGALRFLLAVVAAAVLACAPFADASRAFAERLRTMPDLASRLEGAVRGSFPLLCLPPTEDAAFGRGPGAAHQGAALLAARELLVPEDEWPRVALEIGIPGLLLLYGLRLTAALRLLRGSRDPRCDARLRPLVGVLGLLFLASLPGLFVFNATFQILHWVFFGAAIALVSPSVPSPRPAVGAGR